MNREQFSPRDCKILLCLSTIPKKMVSVHGAENTTEFVLHELCSNYCFNFHKAAYFVDNPDFNCCKGVAGCCDAESYQEKQKHWQAPAPFSAHMKQAAFNQKVRNIHQASVAKDYVTNVQDLARQLDMKNPGYHTWELKNGNKGLLVFEHDPANYDEVKDHLEEGLSLLAFCPIF